jgi:hypothetical protein
MTTALAKSRVHALDRLAKPERCFSCNESFRDSDQVALISTETGFVCEIPGDLARYVVWQPGDAEVFHKACWERLGITKAPSC